jgi:threonine/homoserine/homoserine lactone efflux protein
MFSVIKWIGAAYLVWMGLGMIRSTLNGGSALQIEDTYVTDPIPAKRVFWNATVVTALNPKGIVFFIAFVPQFIDQSAQLLPQFAILTATFVCLGAGNALFYALVANRMRVHIREPAGLGWMTRRGGGVGIAGGVLTATLRKAG